MNWKKLVEDHHKWAHSSGEYELATGEPASKQEIDSIVSELGFPFPSDFVDFYSVMNGFGIRSADHGTEWFFLPLTKIRETQAHTEEMMASHPEFGNRFVPIIDWMCGDYTGYIKPNATHRDLRLFMLEHEKLEYDPAQDPGEFLFPLYTSIEEFLTPDG